MSFTVTAVGSGAEALQELTRVATTVEEPPYDLVLLDWMMPEMDGFETLCQLAANPPSDILPCVILITAHGREFAREIAEESEAGKLIGAYLDKPVNQMALRNAILSVICRGSRADAAENRETPDAVGNNRLSGSTILLVEDNDINQQVAFEILSGGGIKVDIANNGREALARIKAQHYDAVLMDIQMPEMDGYEATAAIREDRRYLNLPVIAMTAHALDGERNKCLVAGMNDYVTKPIDPDLLFTVLSRWIEPITEMPISATPSPASAPKGLPPSIPGIDMPSALKMLGGNESLLRQLLGTFRAKYLTSADAIDEYLSENDVETATRLAHTLKGVSGNLGAVKVFKAAAELEALLREGGDRDQARPLLASLELALGEIGEGLDEALGPKAGDL